MKKRKKKFTDWDDLGSYLASKEYHMISLLSRVSIDYPGIVETIYLYSPDAGKSLVLIHNFESFGLDWAGDIGEQARYIIPNLEALKETCNSLEISICNFSEAPKEPENLPSVYDEKEKTEKYREGWNMLQKDFADGKLYLNTLEREKES